MLKADLLIPKKMKKKKVFVKTKSIKELEKEFGQNWRQEIIWNNDGNMEHLAGKTLICTISGREYYLYFDERHKYEWSITKPSIKYTFTFKEIINKLLKL